MAANRFATMLHKNGTHKLVLLLVYAVLEWVLILLLLLNSLFSYLITKFAIYFGLQKPCLWCSRVDHILEPGKHNKCFTDLLCESHAAEISQLGYCSNHRKLAESRNMCWDCLASRPSCNERLENDDESVLIRCCCCNESLSRKHNPDSFMLFRPSWGSLEYAQKGDLVMEAVDDDENNNGGEFLGRRASHKLKNHESNNGEELDEAELVADCSFNSRDTMEDDCLSSSSMFICYEKEAMEDSKGGSFDIVRQGSNGSSEIVRQFSDVSIVRCPSEENDLIEDIQRSSSNDHRNCSLSHRLIPVELIDFSTQIDRGGSRLKEANLSENGDRQDENVCSESRISSQLLVPREATVFNMNESPEKKDNEEPGNLEMVMDLIDRSSLREADEGKQSSASKESEQVLTTREVHALQIHVKEAALAKQNELLASEQERHFSADAIVSKTMVPTHASECAANQDNHSVSGKDVNICTDPGAFLAQDELGVKRTEKATEQGKTSSFETNQESTEHSGMVLEPNEAKEDKLPDTPTSTDSLHHLDKKLLLSEKRESGAKESLDGSVVSELEGGDGVTSIEQLKTALKSERKALSALYSELEEERSASAIAANQTMAMITRLQEEKAAMQMEALQYQRMMEEQSEYDQEALQLLNDLMVKREKEKQELEKELEEYRKKVLDYEEKEKMRMIRRLRNGSLRSRNSSASCSHAWDIDDLSIDLNRELRDEDSSSYGHQENIDNNITPADTVQNLEEIALDCVKHISILDDSLTEFEEERLSILDQLKALEEKLVKLGDEDEGFSNDLKMIADSSRSHVLDFEENQDTTSRTTGENGISDVFSNDIDYMERKMHMDSTAKKLLPLLDAAGDGNEGHFIDEEKIESKSVETQNSQVSTFESESNRVAIEEEVDHVYERLQALEADREFLKNCMSSVKKGDKGMDLLQEILQHLRDLKTIEVRMKSTNDDDALGEVALN